MTTSWEALQARFAATVADPDAPAPENLYWLMLVHGVHLLADERFQLVELGRAGSSPVIGLQGPTLSFWAWDHHGERVVKARAPDGFPRGTIGARQYVAYSTGVWPTRALTTSEEIETLSRGRNDLLAVTSSEDAWREYLARADQARSPGAIL